MGGREEEKKRGEGPVAHIVLFLPLRGCLVVIISQIIIEY